MAGTPQKLLKKFDGDQKGNVAMIAALSIIPILSIAGFAIDMQMTTTQKNKVQHVIDSAVIAGSKAMQAGKSRAQISQDVNEYVNALLAQEGDSTVCGNVTLAYEEGTQDINASIYCHQKTTLSQIMGKDRLNFFVDSGTTYGIGKLDVAFVFDLSGSMNGGGRLRDLKDAAKDAIDVLLPPGETPTGDVRVSIATYNHSVNAGQYFDKVTQKINRPSVLETSEIVGVNYEERMGYVQIDPQYDKRFFDYEQVQCLRNDYNGCREYVDYAARSYYESTCVYNRRGDEAFSDADPSPNNNWRRSDPVYAGSPIWNFYKHDDHWKEYSAFWNKYRGQDEVEDVRGYLRSEKNGPLSGRYWNNGNNWVTSSGAFFDGIKFNGNLNSSFRTGDCRPNSEPQPLTDDGDDLKDFIDDMTANGGTAGHLGLAWGWYLLSPNWKDVWPNKSEPLAYDEPDSTKVLIMMSDGEFNSTHALQDETGTALAARYCDNIKADTNIVIFTVGFKVPGNVAKVSGTNQTIIDYCATGPNYAFNANSEQQLTEAYVGIAQSISDLRITR